MPQILYRPDLDDTLCDHPAYSPEDAADTHPVPLQQLCHPGTGLELGYLDGLLQVVCHTCHRPVALIAVKERPDG